MWTHTTRTRRIEEGVRQEGSKIHSEILPGQDIGKKSWEKPQRFCQLTIVNLSKHKYNFLIFFRERFTFNHTIITEAPQVT